jgi:hypothetical protein
VIVVWRGVVWCFVVLCGVVLCGVVWCGVVLVGVVLVGVVLVGVVLWVLLWVSLWCFCVLLPKNSFTRFRYVTMVKEVLRTPRNTTHNTEILNLCKKYIIEEIIALNDSTLDKEIPMLDSLIAKMALAPSDVPVATQRSPQTIWRY